MALLPWIQGTVINIREETADTRRFWIQVEGEHRFDFKPGQFVTLDLPIHEKPNKRWRSYSIASAPDGTNVFELLIVLNPEGLGTPYLFNQVSVGSALTLRGPQGVFLLKEPIDRSVFFICTGTGIAPFRSMLRDILHQQRPHQSLYLIYGSRYQSHLFYADEMRTLENELIDFHYIPTLSRDNWDGKTGYVHAVYEELCAERQPAHFYLCGWRNMIDEAKQRILAMGYDKKDIHLEIYG
ncbi:MAG: ferredoxin--NADP reductase [Ferruginibacter sp.]